MEKISILVAVTGFFFSVALFIWISWDFFIDDPTESTAEIGSAMTVTPDNVITETYYRELICQEDEDIVVTLADNDLPYAFCLQVIER